MMYLRSAWRTAGQHVCHKKTEELKTFAWYIDVMQYKMDIDKYVDWLFDTIKCMDAKKAHTEFPINILEEMWDSCDLATDPTKLSTEKMVKYVNAAYNHNFRECDRLIKLLINNFESDNYVRILIDVGDTGLFELIVKNNEIGLNEQLMIYAAQKGRVGMAKCMYERMNPEKTNEYENVRWLLRTYKFAYDKNENTIDLFVMALINDDCKILKRIMSHINPSFWDNWAIKYAAEYCGPDIVHILLQCPSVDPASDDNYALRKTIEKEHEKANMLLKHPMVPVEYINSYFVNHLIIENCLCVTKKILNENDKHMNKMFKECIESRESIMNDVIYFCGKNGICDHVTLFGSNRVLSRDYLLNNEYILKNALMDEYCEMPYSLMVDPHEIFKMGLKMNDISLLSMIRNFSVSIESMKFLEYVDEYDIYETLGMLCDKNPKGSKNKMIRYVWDRAIIEFVDINSFIRDAVYEMNLDSNILDTIFWRVSKNGIDVDFDYICDDNSGCINSIDELMVHAEEFMSESEYENLKERVYGEHYFNM